MGKVELSTCHRLSTMLNAFKVVPFSLPFISQRLIVVLINNFYHIHLYSMESVDQAITDQTTVRTLDLVHHINPVLHNSTFRNRSLNASNHYFSLFWILKIHHCYPLFFYPCLRWLFYSVWKMEKGDNVLKINFSPKISRYISFV